MVLPRSYIHPAIEKLPNPNMESTVDRSASLSVARSPRLLDPENAQSVKCNRPTDFADIWHRAVPSFPPPPP